MIAFGILQDTLYGRLPEDDAAGSLCEGVWLPADAERWHAHFGGDDLDEPAELVFYCPSCAECEFGDD